MHVKRHITGVEAVIETHCSRLDATLELLRSDPDDRFRVNLEKNYVATLEELRVLDGKKGRMYARLFDDYQRDIL